MPRQSLVYRCGKFCSLQIGRKPDCCELSQCCCLVKLATTKRKLQTISLIYIYSKLILVCRSFQFYNRPSFPLYCIVIAVPWISLFPSLFFCCKFSVPPSAIRGCGQIRLSFIQSVNSLSWCIGFCYNYFPYILYALRSFNQLESFTCGSAKRCFWKC